MMAVVVGSWIMLINLLLKILVLTQRMITHFVKYMEHVSITNSKGVVVSRNDFRSSDTASTSPSRLCLSIAPSLVFPLPIGCSQYLVVICSFLKLGSSDMLSPCVHVYIASRTH